MSSEIKFIFFDMGKVLLHFDHQKLVDQVASVSGLPAEEAKKILFQSPHDLENRFEKGEFDAGHFHGAFCEAAKTEVDKEALMEALSDIFWLNTPIVQLLTQLASLNFPMAILSNTCSAHWEFVLQRFAVLRLFGDRVLSYEEKSMKPDGKIYQAAIVMAKKQVSCETNEIFFVDDKPENIAAARDAGMHAELFENTRMLTRQLVAGGVPVF